MSRWIRTLVWIPAAVMGVACAAEDAAPAPDGDASSGGRPAASADPSAVSGEIPDVEPVGYSVFDEIAEAEPPRRVTLHMLVSTDATRDQLRATLTHVLEEKAEADSETVALRAIGYRPSPGPGTEVELVPFVWAEWLPNEGWYEATADARESLHRIYFYHELAPEW